MADIVQIMDFAADDIAPVFYVGSENRFQCVPDIPLSIMQQIAKFRNVRETLEKDGDLEVILQLFDELLVAESAELFRARVEDKTIGIKRLLKILPWVMEEYGLGRPTQPSKPSSDGSLDGATGTSSEDGASHSESTS
jgi:hypothetical protein